MKLICFFNSTKEVLFKRWKDAGYAVFSTLKRSVRIGVLSIAYFSCLGVYTTFAQVETDTLNTRIKLNEVEVSARRSPVLYSEVGRVVTVLSRAQIDNMAVQSIQELLRTALGVDVRERGPLGAQADVSMRGGTSDQVMILLNGINITDPQTGHHALNLPVDLQSIDRIEIIQGSGARIYGPNAFNGAINFITGESSNNKIKVNASGGEHNLYNIGGAIFHQQGVLKNYVAAQKTSTDGYINNTDFNTLNLFYHGQLQLSQDKLSFQLGYTEKEFGANAFYSATYPNQFEATRTLFSSLSMEMGRRVKVRPHIYWRRHNDRFELFRNNKNAPSWYNGHNYHLTDVTGAAINTSIPHALGVTSIGGEVRGESVWSNVLGTLMDEPMSVPGESDASFTHSFTRINTSLFFEHNINLSGINISVGVLANKNSQTGIGVDWFPGVDVSYWLTSNLKWMAAYNKSLRLPTFTDLFYDGPDNVGNANLKPEEANSFESGFRYRQKGVDLHVGGFYRKGKNLIDWGRMQGETVYTTSNINEVKALGVESSAVLQLDELLPQQWIRNLNISYNWILQKKSTPENYQSVYVLNHLKHKLNVGFEHGTGIKPLAVHWNFLFRDREGGYIASATQQLVDYEPVWLTDLRVIWKQPNYKLYVEATNLMNQKYSDLGELVQPGRWLRVGFSMDFIY